MAIYDESTANRRLFGVMEYLKRRSEVGKDLRNMHCTAKCDRYGR